MTILLLVVHPSSEASLGLKNRSVFWTVPSAVKQTSPMSVMIKEFVSFTLKPFSYDTADSVHKTVTKQNNYQKK
jgi:hypothetical protein